MYSISNDTELYAASQLVCAKQTKLEKLAPCRTDGRLLLRVKFFQVQSHVTQKKTNTGIENLERRNVYIVL